MKKSKLLRSPRDKKSASSNGAKILKRSSSILGSKKNTLTSPLLAEVNPFSPHGTPQPTLSTPSPFGLGNMAQEQSHTYTRRGDGPDQSSAHEHSGMGRGGSLCSVEASLPNNSDQCKNRELGSGPSGVGNNTKFMMEIPHKHATNFVSRIRGVEQAEKAINDAAIGRIGMASSGKEGNRI